MKKVGTILGAGVMLILSNLCCIGPFLSLAAVIGLSTAQVIWLIEVQPYFLSASLLFVIVELIRRQFSPKTCCTPATNEDGYCAVAMQKQNIVMKIITSDLLLWGVLVYSVYSLLKLI